MQISTMDGPFGAIAEGLDVSRPLAESQIRQLIDALHEHQILVITGQKLDDGQFLAFGNNWGRPLEFFIDSHRNDAFPQVIEIANRASTPERYRDGAMHWHSDSSYEEVPASVTMLYCLEAPEDGGETLFASSVLAYDALDAETRAGIDDLVGLHCLGGSPAVEGEKIPMIAEATARHGIKEHPLVMRHPVTGRKALFTSGTAFGAKGYGCLLYTSDAADE